MKVTDLNEYRRRMHSGGKVIRRYPSAAGKPGALGFESVGVILNGLMEKLHVNR